MTQIASLIVVATVCTWLMVCKYLHYSIGGGVVLIHEIKLSMQELELKIQGSLCARGA